MIFKRLRCLLLGHRWAYNAREGRPSDIAGVCTCCDVGGTWALDGITWRQGIGWKAVSTRQSYELWEVYYSYARASRTPCVRKRRVISSKEAIDIANQATEATEQLLSQRNNYDD